MQINKEQLSEYLDKGFLLIEDVFSLQEVDIVLQVINEAINDQNLGRVNLEGLVLEENKTSIRTINGLHLKYTMLKKLCCHPRLLVPAQELVRDKDLYVHQFKVNFKEAFSGDIWDWHQDYIYWLKGDGMLEAKATSVVLFLDDVTEFNGPLMFIPKSHKVGVVDVEPEQAVDQAQPGWLSNVTAKLKYTASKKIVRQLADEFGLIAPKARRGSIMFFDGNLLHASTNNLSPFDRRFILITYNPVSNVHLNFSQPRPDFLATRDFTTIIVEEDDLLKTVKR